LHPAGQQPSPLTQVVMAACAHTAEQLDAAPVNVSAVQALPSLQSAGQLPSQTSPGSTWPLPHDAEQSLSLLWLQPAGQQPSPPTQALTAAWVQAVVQALPTVASVVQAMPSSQL